MCPHSDQLRVLQINDQMFLTFFSRHWRKSNNFSSTEQWVETDCNHKSSEDAEEDEEETDRTTANQFVGVFTWTYSMLTLQLVAKETE